MYLDDSAPAASRRWFDQQRAITNRATLVHSDQPGVAPTD